MSLLLSVLGRKAKDAYSPVLALLLGRFRKARASLVAQFAWPPFLAQLRSAHFLQMFKKRLPDDDLSGPIRGF
ncbi:hypothetical protein L207DRAFT_509826 [Hyaloscypha variabilis F]|uniref:Uncharacterized protein n=1 Tax=Hyaloscypha variabilis (strain UAMH 11265 / GT02V1 / F) TaxID=1149755 RepID=A0A2J6RXS4_HYAVF|nr:hypothetical protein L207DRAFT_509826 [Hyaloscypha variabilis F]